MRDKLDVGRLVPARCQQVRNARQVGDSIQVHWGLFSAKCAVEVRTDAGVTRIAGDLAHVIKMINDSVQLQTDRFRRRFPADPARHHHPRVQRRADHPAALDECLDLFVAELAIVRHQRAAVLMACPDSTVEQIERFPEAIVAKMRHVENHSQPFSFLEQLATLCVEPAAGVCAVGINSRPVMRRTDGAQALFVGALQMLQCDDGIRSFKTQDVADGQLICLRGSG